jgi:4-amino-4-deoxy-L-arabinose transferase-like glycosyltransferase
MAFLALASATRRRAASVRLPATVPAGWLIAVGVVLHLVLASSSGLSPDEAHYALYGAHLDWSYFDHPPLVGWLQAPFVAAGGADLLMRVVPMASWLLAVVSMIALCRRLPLQRQDAVADPARVDAWVALMMLASPMLNLLGVALVPDSLLMPLVPAVMSATWSLRTPEQAAQWRPWMRLSALLGLCVLAKYTGVFVVLGALLSLGAFHGARLLRLPGAWLGACVVVAMASPILAWNVSHRWASVAYQFGHAVGDQPWQLRSVLRAVALQAAVYGLLLPIAAARALRTGAGLARGSAPAHGALVRAMGLAFGLPVLVVFAVMAGRGSSLPHWTACGWVALVPLGVAGGLRMGRRAVGALVLWQGLLLGAIVVLVLTGGPGTEAGAAAASPAGLRAAGAPRNPIADVVGWEAAALHGQGLADQRRARGLVVMNWSLASRLAWYARPMPVFVAPERADQFRMWFGALQPGDSAVVVDWSQMPLTVPTGADGFARCTPIGQLATVVDGRQLAHFNYLYCEAWQAARRAG